MKRNLERNLAWFRLLLIWKLPSELAVIPFLFSCLLSLSMCSLSVGQDNDAADADFEVQLNPGALPRMNRAQLEEYLYNSLGGSKAAFHKTKRESIRRELDRVHSICTLTEQQWTKLNEAIEVDIQHIETKMNSLMSSYDAKMTPQVLQDMQSKVWNFASSLQTEKPEANSVWHKVLISQLTKEQSEKLKADEEKKLENQIRTQRLRILLSLQRKLGLNAVQRGKIDEWLSLSKFHELEFQMICLELAKSEVAKEVLRADQVASLEKTSPKANLLQMNPILPRIDFR